MEAEVKPEAAAGEREAILAALAARDPLLPPAAGSAWRRAALREAAEESNP